MHFTLSILATVVAVSASDLSLRDDATANVERPVPFVVNTFTEPTVNKVIPIVVGGSSLTFTPNSVAAEPGDILQFQFAARNHTVTESTEGSPCQPIIDGPMANVSVHSGFIPFNSASQSVGTFNVVVRSNDTMFLYCAQARHCQEGMVLVVNPDDSAQVIAYANRAAEMNINLPGRTVNGGIAGSLPLTQAAFPITTSSPTSTTTTATARSTTTGRR